MSKVDWHSVSMSLLNGDLALFKQVINKTNCNAYADDITLLHYVCISDRSDRNDRSDRSDTLFHNVCNSGRIEMIRYLIVECGVNVDVLDCNQFSPLCHALERGNLPVARFLLQHGAHANHLDPYGKTHLDQLLEWHRWVFSRPDDRNIWLSLVWSLLEHGGYYNKMYDLPTNERPQMVGSGRGARYEKKLNKCLLTIRLMMTGRTSARKAAVLMVGVKRFGRSPVFRNNNIDIARYIGKLVWQSRVQYQEWSRNAMQNKN